MTVPLCRYPSPQRVRISQFNPQRASSLARCDSFGWASLSAIANSSMAKTDSAVLMAACVKSPASCPPTDREPPPVRMDAHNIHVALCMDSGYVKATTF